MYSLFMGNIVILASLLLLALVDRVLVAGKKQVLLVPGIECGPAYLIIHTSAQQCATDKWLSNSSISSSDDDNHEPVQRLRDCCRIMDIIVMRDQLYSKLCNLTNQLSYKLWLQKTTKTTESQCKILNSIDYAKSRCNGQSVYKDSKRCAYYNQHISGDGMGGSGSGRMGIISRNRLTSNDTHIDDDVGTGGNSTVDDTNTTTTTTMLSDNSINSTVSIDNTNDSVLVTIGTVAAAAANLTDITDSDNKTIQSSTGGGGTEKSMTTTIMTTKNNLLNMTWIWLIIISVFVMLAIIAAIGIYCMKRTADKNDKQLSTKTPPPKLAPPTGVVGQQTPAPVAVLTAPVVSQTVDDNDLAADSVRSSDSDEDIISKIDSDPSV
ncbi:uncharacterized protein LOC128957269 [Oppia nitens]|uniref:uncharacterized protein LOC128957269 n=1 Tax=Oppia nitens TaxID=1686743 RepID=UPI0023D992F3|nr:uncharacterized protein LOC128957269 [Oppia nitens]